MQATIESVVARSLLVFLLPAAGCGANGAPQPRAPDRTVAIQLGVLPGAGSLVTLNGVRIEVGTDVSLGLPAGFTTEITRADGSHAVARTNGPDLLVDGEVLDVVDGRLMLGGRDHGPVTPNAVVRVSSQGVLVVDAPRGEDS